MFQLFTYVLQYNYRPQTKFAKVMFLHVSVILSTGGGLPQCMLGYHPPEQTPPPRPGTHPLRADTPWTRHPPPSGADTSPPGAVHARRYGQRVGGMHPTGMQSCF